MINTLKKLHQFYLPTGSLRTRFAKGAFWCLAGAVIARVLTLFSSIIIARFLGKIGFGELGMIQSTFGMFGAFAGLGLGMTAIKYVAEFMEKDPQKTGRIIGLSYIVSFATSGITAIILIIIAPYLAIHMIAAPHLTSLLRISAGLLFFGALNGVQTGAIAGFGAFKTIAWTNFLGGIISVPLTIIGVWHWGLIGVITGLVISLFVNFLINHAFLKNECKKKGVVINFSGYHYELPILWKFTVPAFLSSIMSGPVIWICNAMLVNQPNGYAEMGIFNAANQWRNALLFLPSLMSGVNISIMSDTLGKNESYATKKVFLTTTYLNAVALLIGIFAIAIFSSQIMKAYGDGFIEGRAVLIFLLVVAFLLGIETSTGDLIAASGKMWIGFLMNLGWAIALISSTWLLLNYGAKGLAGAYVISYFVHGLWSFGFAYHYFLRGKKHER
ncbi:MAG: oligosaccharide flippase family protein [bacterium]